MFKTRMNSAFPWGIFFLIFFLINLGWFSCQTNNSPKNIKESPEKDIVNWSGEKLSHIYCAGCHEYTPPEMLTRKIWKDNIFPAMGPFMGIYSHRGVNYSTSGLFDHLNKDLYPIQRTIDELSWQKMMDFYTSKAPDSLVEFPRPSILDTVRLTPFKIHHLRLPENGPHSISLVKIDSKNQMLYWGNAFTNQLNWLHWNDKIVQTKMLPSSPVYWEENPGNSRFLNITCIGSINPDDRPKGSLVQLGMGLPPGKLKRTSNTGSKEKIDSSEKLLFSRLPRPVQTITIDLDHDGLPDYLVCGFGHLKGSFFWLKNNGFVFTRKILRNTPGALHAIIEDVNKDGLPDIWVLFAQAKEGISLFMNQGNGQFEEKKILKFPPIQGSSSFEMADMNGDGLKDIIYTCGDNADYSPVLKNFHGVYIFLNQGNLQFKKSYFYPIHGCFKSVVGDFNLDGITDMVTISFFPDFKKNLSESLIYFQGKGKLNFKTLRLPGFDRGRWLTLDSGDIDRDGDIDLILGNFAVGPNSADDKTKAKWNKDPAIMVLENKTR